MASAQHAPRCRGRSKPDLMRSAAGHPVDGDRRHRLSPSRYRHMVDVALLRALTG